MIRQDRAIERKCRFVGQPDRQTDMDRQDRASIEWVLNYLTPGEPFAGIAELTRMTNTGTVTAPPLPVLFQRLQTPDATSRCLDGLFAFFCVSTPVVVEAP